ncbi:hypothetical protein BpOF4_05205 [Alkalihalophilus pseudofirmus OF4]|uniref:Uncharacterized protein n=1 Tax=Alkalihalophilus pseudofirmus (strain ATCC BAA-2126 / JCM 17055 / OF4) TaxID=398511 RepID=D3FY80_ALKPO|nr:hypothetical protein BpOF4_05205 [Alkalihalophilus pseudofirmus OF4]
MRVTREIPQEQSDEEAPGPPAESVRLQWKSTTMAGKCISGAASTLKHYEVFSSGNTIQPAFVMLGVP